MFRKIVVGSCIIACLAILFSTTTAKAITLRSLDGSGNNVANPTWGQVDIPYERFSGFNYEDGVSTIKTDTNSTLPNSRYVSNRIFNDSFVNIFDEQKVTQFGFAWGQFMDHTIGLAETGGAAANIGFDNLDPLEDFTNTLFGGVIPFSRNLETPGTGTSVANPREQTNTVSSYIDGWSVYGGTDARLDWIRVGSLDGDPTNNDAKLLVRDVGGKEFLPRATERGDATGASAPTMAVDGRLIPTPENRAIAGDARANENIALTGLHTLFVREHNRIVDLLPVALTEEKKFQIARKVVGAEQQAITYGEFLPSLGLNLPAYSGYDPLANAGISTEFATVAYRAHSMIHGEFELEVDAGTYTLAELAGFAAQGVVVEAVGGEVKLAIPLNVAFFNPDLLEGLGVGNMLSGLAGEAQYKNDEQIDNQLRSLLFQVPNPGFDPLALDGPESIPFFDGVIDLGAIDIERGRDHGIVTYNDLRVAMGLAPATSFIDITAEATEALTGGVGIDDPEVLEFLSRTERVQTIAARLKAIYGDVNDVDAFVGMVSEAHLPGKSFGELQAALWAKQFLALRDGDRFFFENDSDLDDIFALYGIEVLSSLKDILVLNTMLTAADLQDNVFLAPGLVPEPSTAIISLIGVVILVARRRAFGNATKNACRGRRTHRAMA